MSLIFGIKESAQIVIAGDKRGSSWAGDFITDNLNKVTVINEHLCLASAGCASIEQAIQMDISKLKNIANLTVNDLLIIIKNFYMNVLEKKCDSILNLPFYFIIAGKGQGGNGCLVTGGSFKGKLDAKEVPMVLYPPTDTNMNICNNIFAKNYKLHKSEFAERTINEISDISKLVSKTGEKWVYNITTEKGTLYSF